MIASRADATERLRAVLASQSRSELTHSLDDPSPAVARAAIRRLAAIEGEHAAPELRAGLLSADPSLVADIAEALRRTGDQMAVERALGGLREEQYTRRLVAARALGALGDARAVGPLRATLDYEIAGVRAAALGALADIGADADTADDCARRLRS